MTQTIRDLENDDCTRLIAELRAQLAEADAQLAEAQAAFAEDIACPYCELLAETQAKNLLLEVAYERMQTALVAATRWVRITDDPATWPPDDDAEIATTGKDSLDERWISDGTGHGVRRLLINRRRGDSLPDQWLPITPPEP